MLCHQILSKLCVSRESAILGAIQDILVPLGKTLGKKVKDAQAGTEVERRNDVIRSALRVLDAMQVRSELGSARAFEAFYSEHMKKEHLRQMMSVIRNDRGDSVARTGK